MLSHNLFYHKIKLLTGDTTVSDPAKTIVKIPARCDSMGGEGSIWQYGNLNDVARIVHKVLSREEEYGGKNLDQHGRFDHDNSFLFQKGLDQSPIIDELVLDVLNQLNIKSKIIWPDGKKAAVCLTHDVDSIDGFSYFWVRKLNWYSQWFKAKLKSNNPEAKKWVSTIKKWKNLKKKNIDPMFSFSKIQDLEGKYGFRSTFFFMSLQHGLSKEGRRYSVHNPKVAKVGKELIGGGWEVGLHAAYHNHLSLSSLIEQKKRLENVIQHNVSGCRHHYLRVRFPESWILYSQAGFKYSSNMGWGSGFQGFRAGTCIPYYPLMKHSILEVPFQLMDMSHIDDIDAYFNKFNKYLNSAKAVNGCIVINFHQEYFQENGNGSVGQLYRNMLEYISKDQELIVLKMDEVQKIIENEMS